MSATNEFVFVWVDNCVLFVRYCCCWLIKSVQKLFLPFVVLMRTLTIVNLSGSMRFFFNSVLIAEKRVGNWYATKNKKIESCLIVFSWHLYWFGESVIICVDIRKYRYFSLKNFYQRQKIKQIRRYRMKLLSKGFHNFKNIFKLLQKRWNSKEKLFDNRARFR